MDKVRVGDVISRAFSVWLRNFVPFTLLAAIVYLPSLAYTGYMVSDNRNLMDLEKLQVFLIIYSVGSILLGLIVTGAITYGVFEQIRGRPAPLVTCLRVGLSRLLPVIGTGIVAALCIAGGLVLLIVPGVILMCMLWLAVPATVVERVGVLEALKRSKQLTDGYKGTIFGIIFVVGLIQGVISQIFETALLGDGATLSSVKTYLVVSSLLGLVFTTLFACANVVTYHDIRQQKEGVDVEQLLEVFA